MVFDLLSQVIACGLTNHQCWSDFRYLFLILSEHGHQLVLTSRHYVNCLTLQASVHSFLSVCLSRDDDDDDDDMCVGRNSILQNVIHCKMKDLALGPLAWIDTDRHFTFLHTVTDNSLAS